MTTADLYRAGWLAAFAEVQKVLDALASSVPAEPINDPLKNCFRYGQEAALLVARHRIAEAATVEAPAHG